MTEGQRIALQAVRDGLAAREGDTAGRVWRSMCLPTRAALVLMALDPQDMSAEQFARKAWGSYSDAEKLALGSLSRHLLRELAGAGVLR